MDTYNYSPNGIDYDPDLLYGGPADAAPAASRGRHATGSVWHPRHAGTSATRRGTATRIPGANLRRERAAEAHATRSRNVRKFPNETARGEAANMTGGKTARASENAPRRCAARKSRQRKPPSEE